MRTLRHVVVLARVLSYTKAAKELHITQSALTRSIQGIERDAKVRLFDRDRSGVQLTVIGRSFADAAAALLQEADDLQHLLQRSADGQVGEVRFGTAPLPAKALVAPVLSDLFVARPELRTMVLVRSVDALLQELHKENIEFFICSEGQVADESRLKQSVLGWFPSSLLVRDKHPVFEARNATLDRYPFISTGPLNGINRWPSYIRPHLSKPLHIVEDYSAATRILQTTDAIWVCSAFAATEEIREGRLREIPAATDQGYGSFRVVMYSLDRRSLSPAALHIRSSLQAVVRRLASPREGCRPRASSTESARHRRSDAAPKSRVRQATREETPARRAPGQSR